MIIFFVFVFLQKIFWRKFSVNYRTKDLKFFNFFVVVENFQGDLKITELKNKSITKQSIEQQLFQFIQFKTDQKLNKNSHLLVLSNGQLKNQWKKQTISQQDRN